MTIYTLADRGCYFDGSLGIEYLRDRLADLLEGHLDDFPREACDAYDPVECIASLRSDEWPDDLSDMDYATELMNSLTDTSDCRWAWLDGDLGLYEYPEEDGEVHCAD